MKLKELRKLIREEINHLQLEDYIEFNRKPIDFEDVDETTDYNDLPPGLQKIIDNLEVIDGNKYHILTDISLDTDDQYYIIKKDGEHYIVNNEGYTYPRYVGKITY